MRDEQFETSGSTVLARSEGGQGSNPFRHEAMFYEGGEGFLAGAVPFVEEGLAGEESILVVVDEGKIGTLRDALGPRSGRVDFTDMATVGRNPARIIPAWQRFAGRAMAQGRPFRGIGEPISPRRTTDELEECHRHESLLNLAFSDSDPWWLLCPYDVGSLPADVITEAERHHPFVFDGEKHTVSSSYSSEFDVFGGPLPAPAASAVEHPIDEGSLGAARALARSTAMAAGLGDDRAADFQLAVHELVANHLHHGSGRGRLLAWQDDGVAVSEVRDGGTITGHLVGRVAPDVTAERGRGLWLVNQLCDLVQIRSTRSGCAVRIRLGPG